MDKPVDKAVNDGGDKPSDMIEHMVDETLLEDLNLIKKIYKSNETLSPETAPSSREKLIDEAVAYLPHQGEGWRFTDTGRKTQSPPLDLSTGGAVYELLMKDKEIFRLENRIDELLKERDHERGVKSKHMLMVENLERQVKRAEHLETVWKAKAEILAETLDNFLDRFLNKIN